MSTHPHAKGALVRVFNGHAMRDGVPVPVLEGVARILAPCRAPHRYKVRFPDEPRTFERFDDPDAAA